MKDIIDFFFAARMTLPTGLLQTRTEMTVRVLVQLLDPAFNWTHQKLQQEYEKRKTERPDQCLRYCPHATINNENVTFLVHSEQIYINAGEVMISNEKANLFSLYASLNGQTVINMRNIINRDQKVTSLKPFILTDYIQNSQVTWGSYIAYKGTLKKKKN